MGFCVKILILALPQHLCWAAISLLLPDLRCITKSPSVKMGFCVKILILALSCSFSLLLALYAGLLVVLTTPCIGKDTGAGALALPTLEGALQGFVFTNMDLH